MTDITIDMLPKGLRPGATFDEAIKAPAVSSLPPILDGNRYQDVGPDEPIPPVLWYGILVESPVVYEIAVDDFDYERPEVPRQYWPLSHRIFTKSLLEHIAKEAGASPSIDWQYRWVFWRGKPEWAIVAVDNYSGYPDVEEDMKKVWEYFTNKRGQTEMKRPLWYIGWEPDYSSHVTWRYRRYY